MSCLLLKERPSIAVVSYLTIVRKKKTQNLLYIWLHSERSLGKITSSKEYKNIESMELNELNTHLDTSFCPKGWLDTKPSPSKKKLKLSLSSKKPQINAPVTYEKLCDAAKGVVSNSTKKNNAWVVKTFTAWRNERTKLISLMI